MTKIEFVDSLRRHISVVNDYAFVNETVEYYQNYIETAIAKGMTEEDVMAELGDPRLIAKSIIASRGLDDINTVTEDDQAVTADNNVHFTTKRGRHLSLPVWLVKGGLVAAGVAVVVLVGFVAIKLLPVICVGILAVMLYRFFRDNF